MIELITGGEVFAACLLWALAYMLVLSLNMRGRR